MKSLLAQKIEKRPVQIQLTGRILFLTEDPELIRQQLAGKEIEWDRQRPERNPELRDDITTGEIVPEAIESFDNTLSEFVYTGLNCGGQFPIRRGEIRRGGFVATVSGKRRGLGPCREHSAYAERSAGIQLVLAESFEHIYRQNCQDLGLLTSSNFELIRMIRRGQAIPLCAFTGGEDEITKQVIEYGGLFPYSIARLQKKILLPPITTGPRPMTVVEKIFARHLIDPRGREGVPAVKPGDAGFVRGVTEPRSESALSPVAVFSRHYLGKEAPGNGPESASWFTRDVRVKVPESVKVKVGGRRRPNVAIHDLILKILSLDYVHSGKAWSKVVEFSGGAIKALSIEERTAITAMAAEIGGITSMIAPDRKTAAFLEEHRGISRKSAEAMIAGLSSDPDAEYAHTIGVDAAEIHPMVASPGSPGDGEPVCGLTTRTAVNVAYGGVYSPQDMDIYAQVLSDALAQGCHVPLACRFYIPLGSREMKEYCAERGYLKIFYKTGVTVIEPDDCAAGTASAADLRASPGMIEIGRRNFPRCGSAEQIFLASPFTVAASAVAGYLVEYKLAETRRLARAA